MPRWEPTEVRFWKQVTKTDACWLWTGGIGSHGYGSISDRSIGKTTTHRYSYVLANGPVDPGMEVLHSCHQPRCVRPDHLRTGTHRENMQDMSRAGRSKRKLTDRQAAAARASAASHAEMARALGVAPFTVSRIRSGAVYRFAPGEQRRRAWSPPVMLTLLGRTQNVSAWCRELGVPRSTALDRMRRGLAPAIALGVGS